MRPTFTDGIVLLYNVAVLLSAGYMTAQLGLQDRWLLLGLAVVFGIFWTVYFRIAVLPRLLEREGAVPDEEEEVEPEPGTRG